MQIYRLAIWIMKSSYSRENKCSSSFIDNCSEHVSETYGTKYVLSDIILKKFNLSIQKSKFKKRYFMKMIKFMTLCLYGFSLGLTSCYKEDTGFNEEINPDPYDSLKFHSIMYDFSKKEINVISSSEYKESFENNCDQTVPMTFYPYLDQGLLVFKTGEIENLLDGLECEVPVPNYENDAWSEIKNKSIKTIFGEITSFNPANDNISFTINFDPWVTTKYSYVLTFSELSVPFEATFIGENYGDKYNFSGILMIRVPISCDIKIEATPS